VVTKACLTVVKLKKMLAKIGLNSM